MSTSLAEKVFAFTEEKRLFSAPCHILLGLSGGADSMALLHVLTHWPVEGLTVSAVHIHHGLRDEAADSDERFVRAYCQSNDVSLTVVHADVATLAANERLTLEEAGRRVRYEFFAKLREQLNADYIVTAHTASDQIETVLMHIIRGCGLDGLTGIPCSREYIRRPLLCCSRQEIEAYCHECGIDYVTDETNMDTAYARNHVRHLVLPIMRELNPAVEKALLRLCDHATMDVDFIRSVAVSALRESRNDSGYARCAFEQQPSVIRRYMIKQLFSYAGVTSFDEIHILAAEQATLKGNASVSLPNGWVFSVKQDLVCVYSETGLQAVSQQEMSEFPVKTVFGCREVLVNILIADSENRQNVHSLFSHSVVDYDRIIGKLYLRCRREGDYMHPSGRGVGKSLKKLMNEWRIPEHLRDTYPVFCDDVGVVLVPGYACDERAAITQNTKHYLVCEIHKE